MPEKREIKIEKDGVLLAIIIPAVCQAAEGVTFLTGQSSPFQAGLLKHPAGHIIQPHIHKKQLRPVTDCSEFLLIRSGRLKVYFYDAEQNFAGDYILTAGDSVLLLAGGHGFECLDAVDILEIKQGPYAGVQNDKIRFSVNGE